MSKETEIRHYSRKHEVVRPHDPSRFYTIKIIWHPYGIGRRSEKSGWLKGEPKKEIKFKTWKELRAWCEAAAKRR